MPDNDTVEQIREANAEALAKYAKPVDPDPRRGCSYSVWFPRSGCPKPDAFEVMGRRYCRFHAQLMANRKHIEEQRDA